MTAAVSLPERFDSELTPILRERGQRVTPQRLILHRALREADRHLTAEELLDSAVDRLPNLSLPTVYATLELFEELQVVRRVSVGSGALLWDPRTAEHHHLTCRRCGWVEDIDETLETAPVMKAARRAGFRPDRADLAIVGLCAKCVASGRVEGHPSGRGSREAPGPHLESSR